jgi:hypothetical protein
VQSLKTHICIAFYLYFGKKPFLRTLAMNHRQKHLSACLLALGALLSMAPIQGAWAQTAPVLGTASTFGALGGAGVTCTSPVPALPAITVTGDVGSGPTGSVTGFPPDSPPLCSLSGTVQLNTPAFADLLTAYNTIDTANPCPADAAHNLVGDLGGLTLSPGIYCISGTGRLTGTLTLDGGGNSNAVWIFKAASDLTPIGGATPALRSTVLMANGGQACNVYWRTGTAATFSNTDFVGNVLAGSKITFAGSTLAGRALANTESVTMTGSSISACTGGGTQPPPSCDKDHKHHKHCKHNDYDKPHCDGHQDGHGKWHDWDDGGKGNDWDDGGKGNGWGDFNPFGR